MVPIPIEGLPPLPVQLEWFITQLERDGPRPWSTPQPTQRQGARPAGQKFHKSTLLPGSVPTRIRSLLARNGTMHRRDVIAALPRVPISSIDNALRELRKGGKIERCARATFRLLEPEYKPPKPTIKSRILALIEREGSISRQQMIASLPDVKAVSVLTSYKRLLSDRIIECCGRGTYRRTRAM
jgi:hypothetical protein